MPGVASGIQNDLETGRRSVQTPKHPSITQGPGTNINLEGDNNPQ